MKKNKTNKVESDKKEIEKINIGDLLDIAYVKKGAPKTKNIKNTNVKSGRNKTKVEAEIWMSKKGRAGKVASVVDLKGITLTEQEILFKELKIKLACGGSLKDNKWIIQTSQRDLIKNFLEKKNIHCKLCGG